MSGPGFSHELRQRQTQSLVLAPQLRHSLKILQVAALDLRSVIQEELQSNPTLEELPMEGVSLDNKSPDENTADEGGENGSEGHGEAGVARDSISAISSRASSRGRLGPRRCRARVTAPRNSASPFVFTVAGGFANVRAAGTRSTSCESTKRGSPPKRVTARPRGERSAS